jgi:hypothetical protein
MRSRGDILSSDPFSAYPFSACEPIADQWIRLRTVQQSLEGSRQAGPVQISDAADSTDSQESRSEITHLDLHRVSVPRSGHGSHSEQVKPIDGKSDKWASSSLRNDAGSRDSQSRLGFPLEKRCRHPNAFYA